MARGSTSRSTKVVVGVIRAPHGLRGEVTVEPLTDAFGVRFRKGSKLGCAGVGELTVVSVRGTGKFPIVGFDGIRGRTAAERLRDRDLTVSRAEARRAAGAGHLWQDLIGMSVVTPQGEALGKVTAVLRAGETDVLVVRDGARETLLPAIASVIRDVDRAARRIEALPQEEA